MRFYIVDDVRSIIKVLDRIIEEKRLGEVVGFSTDAVTATAEIIAMKPDVVLADLLMPVKDGISIVKEVKQLCPQTSFIMISQVSNKEMVSEAYNAGVEFFIHKPINIIEVESVINRVTRQIEMEKTLGGLRDILGVSSMTAETHKKAQEDETSLKRIQYLLGILGMMGERGTADILAVCDRCMKQQTTDLNAALKTYCTELGESDKIVKQRIRRAAKKGLRNMAHMGIEDSYSETYQNYAQLVFDFENLRKEMDYLRGAGDEEGKVNLSHFIEGLLIYHENR